ncbi:MAG TPA: gliding motility-associated C-terminal domain-containing protein, partial [Bacteroidia bacterium]|nr:gliding motility-associated C-terminal domain-containing protein [Bacteroidia bacterium]
SASVTITVLNLPVPTITGLTVFCMGDSSMLTAHGGTTYSWSTGSTSTSIYVHSGGTYTVTATNGCGNASTTSLITVHSVTASFTSSVVTGFAPLAVAFVNTSSPTAVSYTWDFGDNTGTVTTFDATHTYTLAGTYTVSLTVFDANGCESQVKEIIVVLEPPSMITLPNVFTPNGDGTNELFMPTFRNITSFVMRIYDRWGVELAEVNTADQGWNGKAKNGNPVVEGTYYYLECEGDRQ